MGGTNYFVVNLIFGIVVTLLVYVAIPVCLVYIIWKKSGSAPTKAIIIANAVFFKILITALTASAYSINASTLSSGVAPAVIWSFVAYYIANRITSPSSNKAEEDKSEELQEASEVQEETDILVSEPTGETAVVDPEIAQEIQTAEQNTIKPYVCQQRDISTLKKKYPYFDYDKCMNNSAFATAVNNGTSVKKAYKLFFKDEIAEHRKMHETSKFWTYKHTIIVAAVVILCASIAVPITLAQNNTINQLESLSSYKTQKILAYEHAAEIDENYKRFLRNFVAVVANDGTNTYHIYGCDKLNLSLSLGFSVYEPDTAEKKGYAACSCYKSSVRERSLVYIEYDEFFGR